VQLARLERAVPYFQKALAIDPRCAEAHNNLAGALHGLGKIQESIAQYRLALEARPRYPEACYHLALALSENGQTQDAQAQFRALQDMQAGALAAPLGKGPSRQE
jgi:tetratricopeptide (TPR) repeat protein